MNYRPLQKWFNRDTKISDNGYVLIFVPEHPKNFKGWYYEHRLVGEKRMGRILESWETIHHISGDRTDNSYKNTFICVRKEHDYADRLTQRAA